MGKEIGQIYKHSQSQTSTLSIKSPVNSYSESQTSSAIEFKTTAVPSITDKHEKFMFCVPKTPSRMMQPSQTMTTYSLVRHKKTNF